MPNFQFRDIAFYSRKEVSLMDFKGKWILLNFWNKHCASCMASFPSINEMQKRFSKEIQFFLVGILDEQGEIRGLYDKLQKRMQLDLPCAFDSILSNRLAIQATPVAIIIGPDGIIRGVTRHFTSKDITDILKGEKPILPEVYATINQATQSSVKYNKKPTFLTNGNNGADTSFLYKSLLSTWHPSKPCKSPSELVLENGNFEGCGVDLKWLYKMAYLGSLSIGRRKDLTYGSFWPDVLIEVKDSSVFESNISLANNLYCYSLSVPSVKGKREYLMSVMQNDLKNYFNLVVDVETRKMPVWRVSATEEVRRKLKSDGGLMRPIGDVFKKTCYNCLIDEILYSPDNLPVLNETGIEGKINITLDGRGGMLSEKSVHLMALEENGLHYIKSEKDFQVLVIKDK